MSFNNGDTGHTGNDAKVESTGNGRNIGNTARAGNTMNNRNTGNIMNKRTELLSPAGSFDSARAAVNAGADAIYMGGPLFSARAYAESSNEDMLLRTLDFCHLRGVRVFMTLNTLLKDAELATVEEYLKPYVERKLDGVIVQDLGVMRLVREAYPELELHISTQMAVTGVRTARRLMEMGASRIVLARELSLKEIREIKEQTGAELEVFAHGALCYSYSGNCLMSSFIGGRSGNRGRCAGTCRLPFGVKDESGKRLNKKEEQYLLSMCDLNTLSRLPEMIEAGVYSFKIEGRMKSPEYTAAVTSVYRKYLDEALECVASRNPAMPDGKDRAKFGSSYAAAEALEGRSYTGGTSGRTLRENEKIKAQSRFAYTVQKEDERILTEVFDRAGTTDGYLDGRNGRSMVTLIEKPEHRSRDEKLIEDIRLKYIDRDVKLPVYARVKLYENEPIELEYSYGRSKGCAKSQLKPQKADKRPTTIEEVEDKISKLGDTDFVLDDCEIYLDEDCFVPMKALNELRRDAAENLEACILKHYRSREKASSQYSVEAKHVSGTESVFKAWQSQDKENAEKDFAFAAESVNQAKKTVETADISGTSPESAHEARLQRVREAHIRVTVESYEQFEACLGVGEVDTVCIDSAFFDAADFEACVRKAHKAGKLIGLRLPYIWRDKAEAYFDEYIEAVRAAGFDVYLFRNTEGLLYFREKGLLADTAFATDSSMYVFNSMALEEITALIPEDVRADYVSATLPLELNGRELENLCAKARGSLLQAGKNTVHKTGEAAEAETKSSETGKKAGNLALSDDTDTDLGRPKNLHVGRCLPALELTVYGRAPMMVTAQCINKTVQGCDHKPKCLHLTDRKGAEMPVRNICRFCYNQVYNSVPTMLYDMKDTIEHIAPDALRYDFTTESAAEVRQILGGAALKNGAFTRGHLKRGV